MHYGSSRKRRGAFTLVELLFTIAIIFLIMGLLLGGIRHVMKYVKATADLAMVNALKSGVTQFSTTFGFLPPLVKDGISPASTTGPLSGPLTNPATVPVVFSLSQDRTFLRTAAVGGATPATPGDQRFSLYSLSYYVMGALDIDGVPGPGFRSAKRDGTFEKTGRTFNPFFDSKGNAHAVVDVSPGLGKVELRDARGVAIRYYRWIRGDANDQISRVQDSNVPWILGSSPMDQSPVPPPPFQVKEDQRNANYAIVAAGPNGLFGDEDLLPGHPQFLTATEFMTKLGRPGGSPTADDRAAAMADNIVVVGVEPQR